MPWLGRGFIHCVHEDAADVLQHELDRLGFSVVVLDGARMTDAGSFHAEAERAFQFPDYYGRNWDAFNECFLETEFSQPSAIIWSSAEQLAAADLKTFAEAVAIINDLRAAFGKLPVDVARGPRPAQIELFLVGQGGAFRRPDDPVDQHWSL